MSSKMWFIALLVFCLFSCTSESINFADMTVEQLTGGGFYAYILPDSMVGQLNWNRTIWMRSFDEHCRQLDTIEQTNPVKILYKNHSKRTPFAVEISPRYKAWDSTRSIEIIELNLDWIPARQAEYYVTESGGITLKFTDKFDMEVVIFSWIDLLSITQIVDLISQLKYAGPEGTLDNPWNSACSR